MKERIFAKVAEITETDLSLVTETTQLSQRWVYGIRLQMYCL